MREIIKVMLQEGISEEVIHEVLDVIQELHAPTDASAKAVFDRKAEELKGNTQEFRTFGRYMATPQPVKPADFKRAYDNDREYERDIHKKGRGLEKSGQRILGWARKKAAKGQLSTATRQSANNMAKAGEENTNTRRGF